MLREIALRDFMAIGEETRLELGVFTILYGPNSAGKSSIMRAAHLIACLLYGSGEYNEHRLKELANRESLAVGEASTLVGAYIELLRHRVKLRLTFDTRRLLPLMDLGLLRVLLELEVNGRRLKHWEDRSGVYIEVGGERRRVNLRPPLLSEYILLDPRYYADLGLNEFEEFIQPVRRLVEAITGLEDRVDLPHLLGFLVSYKDALSDRALLIERVNEGFAQAMELGREFLSELIDSVNFVIEDTFTLEEVKGWSGRVMLSFSSRRGAYDISVSQLSDGLLRLLDIMLTLLYMDFRARHLRDLMKEGGLTPLMLIEGMENSIHVDWLLNFHEWLIERKPLVQVIAETHNGLLLSSVLKRGGSAYYIDESHVLHRITAENIGDIKLFRREYEAKLSLLE
ncbi:MAG: hypothetical protein DRK00_10035 [Thermoprotei archaeon]|nr:MAG: hypothetical protein DRK00_10035 [Thermoprotei archaeon]